MKKLFQNYNYDFTKTELKLLKSFVSQVLKTVAGKEGAFTVEKPFGSLRDKLNASTGSVKFSKEEKSQLTRNLEENIKHFQREMNKGWFFKKWMYKSYYIQYSSILNKLNE